ncbi:DNA polymerase III subunit gamma/tau [bacterium]|nr:DNA polymerase III subunit gamma/tau [bacterium]
MSFLVTARKWRPKSFSEVVGQDGVSRTLQNALKAGRIAHAFIFAGPRVIGKTTTARILAKAVNCIEGPTATPCNVCSPCIEIAEGRSLDVLEIDGASNRGVGEIRNLRDNIHFNPASCRKKIYIIDEVHMLTIEAFNALLKTLEEPPAHSMFIFATTEINRVPATILSRCQRFDFRRISAQEIAEHLRKIADAEGLKADDEALELIARRADGAMRDGQSILDQMATYSPEGITADAVREAMGIAPDELFFQVSDIIVNNRVADAFHVVNEIDERGLSPREFLNGLSEHFLNFIKAQDQGGADFIDASQEVRSKYRDQAGQFDIEDLLRILGILQEAVNEIRRHPQPRMKLELTLLRLAALEKTVQLEELLRELRGGAPVERKQPVQKPPPTQKKTAAEATPATKPPPAPVSAPEPAQTPEQSAAPTTVAEDQPPVDSIASDLKTVRSRWSEIVDRICVGKIPLACQLKMGRPQEISADALVIGFGSDLHDLQLDRLKKVAASGTLDETITEVFGKPIRLRLVRLSPADAEELAKKNSQIDPFEEELIRCLGAKRIG